MDGSNTRWPARSGPILVAAGSLALLFGALGFQYIGDLAPCILCIYQRYPHAIAAALAVIAAFVPATGSGRLVAGGLMAVAGIVLLAGAGIAGFHVGVEQHWWAGTAACGQTGGPASSVAELRAQLMQTAVARCDEIAWSLLGISMAGWNLLLSLALAGLSFVTARTIYRSRPQ